MSFLSSCAKLKHPSEAAGMAEVDVTPVMNMFVILIPFLVSMAVFTHFTILEFSVPPNVDAGLSREDEKPKLRLTLVITEDFLGLTLGDRMLDSIPLISSEHDFAALESAVSNRAASLEIQDEVVVASRDNISFQNIVTAMDIFRRNGFTKIGISSATENPLAGK